MPIHRRFIAIAILATTASGCSPTSDMRCKEQGDIVAEDCWTSIVNIAANVQAYDTKKLTVQGFVGAEKNPLATNTFWVYPNSESRDFMDSTIAVQIKPLEESLDEIRQASINGKLITVSGVFHRNHEPGALGTIVQGAPNGP